MATSFSLDRDKTLEHAPSDLRAGLKKLLERIPSPKEGFFADSLWSRNKTAQWQIKCNEDNFDFIKKSIAGREDEGVGGIEPQRSGELERHRRTPPVFGSRHTPAHARGRFFGHSPSGSASVRTV